MALPSGDSDWPPGRHKGPLADIEEWSAWYSGDSESLSAFYGSQAAQSASRRVGQGINLLANRVRFWGRRGETTPGARARIHVPVASDIASTSADLLFGEEPTIRIREANEDRAAGDAIQAQDRLIEIADQVGLSNILLEGAEICSALGGAYLRPGWDLELSPDCPTLDVIHGDNAVPEWRGGQLLAVTFWRVLMRENNTVMRLLERHEPGVILTGLFVGNEQKLGTQVPLARHPESDGLAEELRLPEVLGQRLLVRYVPNVLPNRKYRGSNLGRSDFAGVESLMDFLDETYTSWQRDIRLGQARIMVSEDALTRGGRGQGAYFDADQEVFTPLNLDPSSKSSASPITPVQFAIRTAEHAETAAKLFEKIVTGAGYSPQTFGLNIEGQAESGTALRMREGKTLKTRARKARYWTPAIEEVLEIMLAIDREVIGNRDHGVYRPSVDEADVIVNNPIEVAQSVSMFRTARAMSIETGVRLAQPELSEEEIANEVQRIQSEDSLSVEPTGGFV